MLSVGEADKHLHVKDAYILLLACLAIGIQHPGTNEAFLQTNANDIKEAAQAREAERRWRGWGQNWPSAEHRVEVLFKVGLMDKCNIWSGLNPRLKKSIKEEIVHMLEQVDGVNAVPHYDTSMAEPLLPKRYMPPPTRQRRSSVGGTPGSHWGALRDLRKSDGNAEDASRPSTWKANLLGSMLSSEEDKVPKGEYEEGTMSGILAEVGAAYLEPLRKDERRKLMTWMLQLARIGYPCRRGGIARKSILMIRDELWRQGSLEKEKGFVSLHACYIKDVVKEVPVSDQIYVETVIAPVTAYVVQALPKMRQAVYNVSRYRYLTMHGETGNTVPPPRLEITNPIHIRFTLRSL